ncbi:IclR family transcriptional regulator [Jatrophihabitans sp. GAS493]|uniref:IclR family transcriptional regulator n=1 Tax=Jatrophihabitans sp. GAS493 TaxID=1907575 RepID=UPI000BB8E548|nr:IclR family transcriptional regulator [Jatrophihabitans sp. GAS493]SOD70849.1 IclR family transcriptional regulator [Jatrophihabitans sp. GAS493]
MKQVPAATHVLQILQLLSEQAGPVPAAVLARELKLPRSSTYHLLNTLCESGFVLHLSEERRYALGVRAYELASGYSRQAPLQRLARVPLARLVDRTGHSAHLAVLHGRDVVYVLEERAPGRAPLITDVGVRLPAHLTASGRAVLAALPATQVRALFPDAAAFVSWRETPAATQPQTISALKQLLVGVRRDGVASESGEITEGFASVAAAVLDHNRHPLAAVAVTYPQVEVNQQRRAALIRQTQLTAARLTQRLSG